MIEPASRHRSAFTLVELLIVIAIIAILAALLFPAISKTVNSGKATSSTNNLRQIGIGITTYLSDHNGVYPILRDDAVPGGNFWSQAITPYLAPPDRGKIYLRNPPDYYVSFTLMDPLLPSGKHHFLGDYGGNPEVFRTPTGYFSPSLRQVNLDSPARLISVITAQVLYQNLTVGSWYVDAYHVTHPAGGSPTVPQDASTVPGPAFRANGFALALFCDGHVERISPRQLGDQLTTYFNLKP